MRSLPSLFLMSSLIGLTSCSTSDDVPAASENGRWVVVAASRGGKSTTTLNAAYFEFDTAKHKLSTNFSGEKIEVDYSREGDLIKAKGSALLSELKIATLTDSAMVFNTNIRNTGFIFQLKPER